LLGPALGLYDIIAEVFSVLRARTMSKIILIDPDKLHVHEAVDPKQVLRVIAEMKKSGRFDTPLLVDKRSLVVLDGHHRLWASKELGYKRLPCYCVDYLKDDRIQLESWRPDVRLTKEKVLEMGLGENMYPQKTTRHIYTLPSFDPVPIEELMNAD
jgi:hypothetical protein